MMIGAPPSAISLDSLHAAILDRPSPLQPVGSPGRHWQEVAAERAGVDLVTWDPTQGFAANQHNVWSGYDYYRRMQLAHPNLLWTGMAFGIGPTFASGMADIAAFNGYAQLAQHRIEQLPAPIRDVIAGVVRVVAGTPVLITRDLEIKLLQMQQAVFLDQGMQHEAYVGGGMRAIRELRDSGAIDDHALDAWQSLDEGVRTGDRAALERGNLELLRREQMQIVAGDYDQIRELTSASPIATRLLTMLGRPAIPGSHTAGDVFPIRIGPVTIPVPRIDISRADARWEMIERDTWPVYTSLVRDHASDFQGMLAQTLDQRIAAGHFRHLPDAPSTWDIARFALDALRTSQSLGGGR